MNRNRYRLVFDHERNMLVPVCEAMPARQKKSTGTAVVGAAVCLGLLGAGGEALAGSMTRAVPASTLSSISRPAAGYVPAETAFTGNGNGSYRVTYTTGANGTQLGYGQVDQATLRAIFNWSNLDIGTGGHVHFNQPEGGSAVSRIGSANPTVIDGMLSATGQIYLINQNGVVFGSGARVNVGGIVASTLEIADETFQKGWLSRTGMQEAFKFEGTAEQYEASFVRVEAGASLTAADGGGIFLFAPRVENAGSLNTTNGQVMLAAGAKVYLASPTDTRMRGFVVEVDPFVHVIGQDSDGKDITESIGGTVSVDTTWEAKERKDDEGNPVKVDGKPVVDVVKHVGEIIANRGNITLAGFAVNHAGRLKATTTVDANGSIVIKARDTAVEALRTLASGATIKVAEATRGGEVTLGAGSQIEVVTEKVYNADGKERLIADSRAFTKSLVDITGKTIVLGAQADDQLIDLLPLQPDGSQMDLSEKTIIVNGSGRDSTGALFTPTSKINSAGARIVARSGEVNLTAFDGQFMDTLETGAGQRIFLGSGSSIDVSGLKNVEVPIDRNIVEVELRGEELRDSPLLRGGKLAGTKVKVDVRLGTKIADISGYVGKIERTVEEKNTGGGSVNIRSEGDVVVRENATVDVSGGSVRYGDGDTGTTRLTWAGGSDAIEGARTDRIYSGAFDISRREAGYLEGSDAGSMLFQGRQLAVAGNLRGGVTAGRYQRDKGKAPKAGTLSFGTATAQLSQDVRLVSGPVDLSAIGAANTLAAGSRFDFWTGLLSAGGFGRFALYSGQRIDQPGGARLEVTPGGEITLSGGAVDLADAVVARGGKVNVAATGYLPEGAALPVASVVLRDSARIDVSGIFTNDVRAGAFPTDPILVNGGSVSLKSEADLIIAGGAVVDASAGIRLARNGTRGLKTNLGDGGSIALETRRLNMSDVDRATATLTLDGKLLAYATGDGVNTGKGGKLSISTSNVTIGGGASGQAGELHLGAGFFGQGGFKDFDINGLDGLTVAAGTRIALAPQTRVVAQSAVRQATGAAVGAMSTLAVAAPEMRTAGSVALGAHSKDFLSHSKAFGDLNIGAGALIAVEAGGSISATADHRIVMEGTLQAKGGSVALALDKLDPNQESYDGSRAIWLTNGSRIDVSGTLKRDPTVVKRVAGEVLGGGSVTVDAASGYLVTQAGSVIDASGTVAALDRRGAGSAYARTGVASPGGSISLSAYEAMLLDGALVARGGNGSVSDGSLSVALDRGDNNWLGVPPEVTRDRQVTLAATFNAGTAGMTPGQVIDVAKFGGRATLGVDRIRAGGFASLALKSQNFLGLSGVFDLSLSRALVLDAPNFVADAGTQAVLRAASVTLGSTETRQKGSQRAAASGGSADVTLVGDQVDLIGSMSTQGIDTLALASTGDLRLRGIAVDSDGDNDTIDDSLKGKLAVGGDLDITAAQVYPTTLTEFELAVHNNPNGTIAFHRTGSESPVLSAGGQLTVTAPHINQGGVLKAPFGTIALIADEVTRSDYATSDTRTRAAAGTVDLADGSVTSVSGAGLDIPFGKTDLSGQDWIYDLGSAKKVIETAPEKRVLLTGDAVTTDAGATIDLSGGGDVKAWEFIAGRGGSKDVLDPLVSANTFAIIPSVGTAFAPFDTQSWLNNSGLKAGDRIRLLTAAGGLAAGEYTLMPARYALLPGAYTVTFKGTSLDGVDSALTQTDGSVLASAVKTAAVAGGGSVAISSRIEQVEIASADVARTKSAYIETWGGDFFRAGGRRPGDAGRLAVEAGSAMALAAAIKTEHASGHRGAEVDLAAKNMAVVGAGQSAAPGSVTIDLASLQKLGAESLLLGGLRSHGANGTTVAVVADNLEIATGAGNSLQGPEIIAVAGDTLTVQADSTVVGTGAGQAETLNIVGDGALLRVAGGAQADLVRTGTSGANATKGTLDLKAGTTLSDGTTVSVGATVSGHSVIVDSTFETKLGGTVTLNPTGDSGGALAVGAKQIVVGGTAGAGGIAFSNDDIAKLGSLRLTSYTTVDLHGGASLGSANLKELTIQAAGIAGYDNAGQTATLEAGTVRLTNPGATAFAPAAVNGTGTLDVKGQTVEIADGSFATQGFDKVNVTADRELRVSGSGRLADDTLAGFQAKGADLTVTTPRIAAATGADQALRADGAVTTVAAALKGNDSFGATGQGARLEISGTRIAHGTRIDLPAGELTLEARGAAATDGVTLQAGSRINAPGYSRTFGTTIASAAGGIVHLKSANGDVDVTSGARVDVSGVDGGNAGRIEISAAKGSLAMNGDLLGKAADDARQGGFSADAKSLGDINALNVALNTGGFTDSRIFRQRAGNVVLGEAGKAQADQRTDQARNFQLAADAGSVEVHNTIDASGSNKGGRIELFASNADLVIHSTAVLDASAKVAVATTAGTAGQGGDVVLGTSGANAAVRVKDGARIRVGAAANSAAQGGSVNFRADRSATDGVNVFFDTNSAINKLASAITGAAEVAVEGVKVYEKVGSTAIASIGSGTSSGSKLGMTSIHNDSAADFSAAKLAALETRLGFTDTADTDYRLRPGVEVRAASDLTVASDWDLKGARYGDNAGVLTLRATGDLKVDGTISDGFNGVANTDSLNTSGDSWSYRLVAGADPTTANPLATQAPSELPAGKGNVTVKAGKLVRTGTGDIAIAAGRDVVLKDQKAAVYTAGIADQTAVDPSFYFVPGFIKSSAAYGANSLRAEFGKQGGDLTIRAGEDIIGTTDVTGTGTTNASQWIGDWLYRMGQRDADGTFVNNRPLAWWARIADFRHGFGTLGGGDITAVAGGSIVNTGFAAPTNGRLPGLGTETPDATRLVVQGGGDVSITAGRNIDSVFVHVAKGTGELAAGDAIGSRHQTAGSNARATYSVLSIGDARVSAVSRTALELESVFNATLTEQASYANSNFRKSYFSTYGDDSTLRLLSVGSGVRLHNGEGDKKGAVGATSNNGLDFYPGTVWVAAMNGDIDIAGNMTLAPAPKGQLDLLASNSIRFSGTGSVLMSDVDPANLPQVWSPDGDYNVRAQAVVSGGPTGAVAHASTALHTGDDQPIHIVAADGDIVGVNVTNPVLILPKAAQISAGGDIRNLVMYGQNVDADDVTSISAGHDLEFATDRDAGGNIGDAVGGIFIGGPGRVEVIAGHDINLGNSVGVVTKGNLNNPYLPTGGASLLAMAGARSIDYAGLASFLSGAGAAEFAGIPKQAYDGAVIAAMRRRTGDGGLDAAAAQAAFAALSAEEREPVLRDALFAVLAQSGGQAAASGERGDYGAGYAALAAAFPGTPAVVPSVGTPVPTVPYDGDINLFFSQVKTEQGGGIDLFAPGGKINAGLANVGGLSKDAYELGVVTLDGGDIRSYSLGNFEVNQSRVFTLGGGDILLWSSYGNLDAGNGAKTAAAAPPAVPRWDPVKQAFVLDVSNSISGSGIGVLLGKEGIVPGNVFLFAPIGEINAGDAGIQAPGKVVLGANAVIGATNIQGGQVVGAPVAAPPAPVMAGVDGGATEANRAAEQQTAAGERQAQGKSQQSLLNVEVLALGEEDEGKKR